MIKTALLIDKTTGDILNNIVIDDELPPEKQPSFDNVEVYVGDSLPVGRGDKLNKAANKFEKEGVDAEGKKVTLSLSLGGAVKK